jgi:hypothetical protein
VENNRHDPEQEFLVDYIFFVRMRLTATSLKPKVKFFISSTHREISNETLNEANKKTF